MAGLWDTAPKPLLLKTNFYAVPNAAASFCILKFRIVLYYCKPSCARPRHIEAGEVLVTPLGIDVPSAQR